MPENQSDCKSFEDRFYIRKSPYDPAFVKKILQGRKDVENGKGVKVNLED